MDESGSTGAVLTTDRANGGRETHFKVLLVAATYSYDFSRRQPDQSDHALSLSLLHKLDKEY